MAYQIPESRYKWRGDQLTAQRPKYTRPTRSAPYGAFQGGGWGWEDPQTIGARGDGGFNFLSTPQSADVQAAGVGRAYSVGGRATPQLMMQQFMDSYTEATQKAELANEERYQQMLGMASGLGREVSARGRQDLVSRGLLGTSALIGTEGAGSDEATRAKLDIIERREDVYPDPGMYHQLAAQYGEWGGETGYHAPYQTPIYAQSQKAQKAQKPSRSYQLPRVRRPTTATRRRKYKPTRRTTIPTPRTPTVRRTQRKTGNITMSMGDTRWERRNGIWSEMERYSPSEWI